MKISLYLGLTKPRCTIFIDSIYKEIICQMEKNYGENLNIDDINYDNITKALFNVLNFRDKMNGWKYLKYMIEKMAISKKNLGREKIERITSDYYRATAYDFNTKLANIEFSTRHFIKTNWYYVDRNLIYEMFKNSKWVNGKAPSTQEFLKIFSVVVLESTENMKKDFIEAQSLNKSIMELLAIRKKNDSQ